MPDRLTRDGKPDRRFRTADHPYVPPERPAKAPPTAPGDLDAAHLQLVARMLADCAADLEDANDRVDALTRRRAELIKLAGAMTVEGKAVTDQFIANYAGVNDRRIQQIRTAPLPKAKAAE